MLVLARVYLAFVLLDGLSFFGLFWSQTLSFANKASICPQPREWPSIPSRKLVTFLFLAQRLAEICYWMTFLLENNNPIPRSQAVVSIKGKTAGFIYIDWVYFVYIMSSCLRCYSIFHELNTIDACWIVVDWWTNSSRCMQESVYLWWTWCLYTWSLPWISS